MDIRTGKTYDTREAALAAGVPESDIAEVLTNKNLEPYPVFDNPKHPIRHQGKREMARRLKRATA